jgi:hypothetical protein
MRTDTLRFGVASLVVMLAISTSQCGAKPEPAAEAATATVASDLKPIFSVKELMENIIDPQSDFIFDAVAVDIGAHGVVETKPTSDEDWLRVQRATVLLAESTNLLKIPRRVAPVGDKSELSGPGQPELAPEQIQAKLDQDRHLWDSHVDQLRDELLKVLEIVKARDSDKLFEAGSNIDRACEACHLEYWYPGDKAAVLRDRNSRVYGVPGGSK